MGFIDMDIEINNTYNYTQSVPSKWHLFWWNNQLVKMFLKKCTQLLINFYIFLHVLDLNILLAFESQYSIDVTKHTVGQFHTHVEQQ